MKKKLLFIYDVHDDKSQLRSRLISILDVFAEAGYETTVKPTLRQGDAADFVLEREDYFELLVCCGGDETLDEVALAMMQSEDKLPIAYIPCACMNDFAKSLDIPFNMVRASHVAVGGKSFFCDMGKFNRRVFSYIAAFGFFTEASQQTKQTMKNVLGHMASLLEGMKRLQKIESYHLKIRYDGKCIEDDFVFGMVTNSNSVGGFKKIVGNNVRMDDGLFEVTLIKSPKDEEEVYQILNAFSGKIIDEKYMYSFKTSKITFEAPDKIPWTRDGEFGGMYQKVEIENLHQAIEIRIPGKN